MLLVNQRRFPLNIDINIGYENILENFPKFEYFSCKHPYLLNFNLKDNICGDQQRAFCLYWALHHAKKGEIGCDIGCGQACSPWAIGIDSYFGECHPEYGGSYHPHLTWQGEKLPFNQNTMGFVIAAHVLEHMDNTIGVLKEWIRIVKPGGGIYIIMPDAAYEIFQWDKSHVSFYTAKEFKEEILSVLSDLVEVTDYDSFKNQFSFNVALKKK